MASQRTISSLWCWFATTAVAAALTLAALAVPAMACQGYEFHQTILLGAVPSVAENSEVIARVEIIGVRLRQWRGPRAIHVARARVLKSIRGTVDGQIVEIYAEPSSCGGGLDSNDVGREGFIAGRFIQSGNEALFQGSWSQAEVGYFYPDIQAPDTRPWWRMPLFAYSTLYYRAALIALILFLLWRVAGWLDRRKSKA